jgi:phosphatidylinositol glycan class B
MLLTWTIAMAVATVARGRVHPDEIFQALEPADRLAFGSGEIAWEWVAGMRNWAIPGLLAGPLRLLDWLGVHDPRMLVWGLWALCAAIQSMGTLAIYRLVEERDGRGPATLAAFLHATWGGFAIYAARTLGDALAIPPLLWSILFASRRVSQDRMGYGLACGTCLGLSVIARYPALVFVLPLGGAWFLTKRWRGLAGFACGLGGALLVLGLLDLATWGSPWLSLRHYLMFNRPGGGVAVAFGVHPWWWYAPIFAGMAPLPLLYPFVQGLRRPGLPLACLLSYLAVILLHPHKEPRFLLPLLPLLTICAARDAFVDLQRCRASFPKVCLFSLPLYAAYSLAAASVLLPFALNRNIVDGEIAAGRDPGLVGLLVDENFWATAGRFYLHRDVPVRYAAAPTELTESLTDRHFSHLLLLEGHPVSGETLRRDGWAPWWQRGDTFVWKRVGADP